MYQELMDEIGAAAEDDTPADESDAVMVVPTSSPRLDQYEQDKLLAFSKTLMKVAIEPSSPHRIQDV